MSIAKLEHEIASPDGSAEGSRHLRVIHAREQVNLPAAERAVHDLLLALGRDPSSPHLADTPPPGRHVFQGDADATGVRPHDLPQ